MPTLWKDLSKIENYPAHLEACWKEHLAARADNAPTVISTFAGGGGSSLGYSMAGFRELLAVEWDDNAVATFKENFHDVPVYHGDIAKLSIEHVLSITGLKPGELDVFDGSPPCQGFSTAGKRMIDDPRNQLFREYVRLLRGLQPKAFVMENVSGMVKGKMKLVFVEILKELKASGYKVSAKLLNAMWFGVPQSRQRMIFIGVRNDLKAEPSHPKATSAVVTVKDAFVDIKQYGFCEKVSPSLAKIIPHIPENGGGDDVVKNKWFSTRRLSQNKPFPTITKSMTGGGSAMVHPNEHRPISIAEAKRGGSFPDEYKFIGGYKNALPRIGNSVPPLFMRAIAMHIRKEILEHA